MPTKPIRVLFICTGNSARSQLAEAMIRLMGGPDFEAFSAGTEPRGVDPNTIHVLQEICIDWTGARSKPLTEFIGQKLDCVITVCDRARQSCPVFPGSGETLHWDLPDPAEVEGTDEDKLEAFRRTRTQVADHLRPFVAEALERRAAREAEAAV